jgi:hypothetical protein
MRIDSQLFHVEQFVPESNPQAPTTFHVEHSGLPVRLPCCCSPVFCFPAARSSIRFTSPPATTTRSRLPSEPGPGANSAGYDLPVRTAITKELAKRGWQYVATGGNTTVFVWGDIQSQAQLDGDYDKYGQGWVAPVWGLQGLGSGWAKDEYGQLTHIALMKPGNNLVVDIFDTASHRLLVRAVGEDDLESTQKNNAKRLEKTIHKMLNQVPKG